MSQRPNILVLLTPGFAASAADSSCLPLLQALVRAWTRMDPSLEVLVLALHYPFRAGRYSCFGATVQAFGGHNRGGLYRWRRASSVQSVLAAAHREKGIAGIVSCWYGETAALGSAFARKHGIPHYCWLLGQDARPGNPWPRRLQLPAGELVALSAFLQKTFEDSYGIRPQSVIEPGVEEQPAIPHPSRGLLLLGVGSLIPLKRWPVFLQVAARLRTRFPALHCILAGEGPELQRLQQLARSLRLTECVQFAEALPHADVLRLMGRARVLLHPSGYEGYSGVCQEALAQGTPVVSCIVPGAQRPKGWWQAATVDEMTERVAHLLQAPAGIARESFPIETTAAQWLCMLGIQSPDNISRSPAAMASGA